ncbi:MAG: class I tRNA ligase family protein, partial [Deltaproteobacteria bacterium]|nr:class I tRNA ligase family protein [Deltaproteobacteria bacterium]
MTDNKNDNEENLSSVYEPLDVEQRWHKEWARLELFKAEATSKKPAFSMVIPPPNITGVLHLGHALNNTLQDIIARYKRQKGFNVLWVPGIDHAGIATQNVVERKLHDEGTTRFELGREKFIERVWQWKEESGEAIITQLKRLGASCDWTRQRFTMDEGLSEAVREVFVTLYEEDLIYRGDYIINWCPRCHTALSDLESEAEEKNGHLWHLTYPTKDGTQSITVATTRPETILGDVAVAVNPDDDRYKDLIGKFLILPLINKEIPIIADSEVDMDFGTGAVKITPAHDFNDFEMAKRHDLPQINIMDVNASLNENAGKYQGLDRFIARKKIVKDLDALGLLKDTEDYKVRLGACYRCHTVVEPRLSKQWFVKVEELAKPAIAAVENGETNFVPKNW